MAEAPVNILYVSAHPIDQRIVYNEYQKIQDIFGDDPENKFQLLKPTFEVNYERILERLYTYKIKPNILHFSGHSSEKGLVFKKNDVLKNDAQHIENKDLESIFKKSKDFLKLIILNSCLSKTQAKIISEFGIWVLGMEKEIDNPTAIEFTEKFYGGIFTMPDPNPNDIKQIIQIGCINFEREHPKKAELISLWKDGIEVDINDLRNFCDSEKIINALYNFNFSKQIKLIENIPKNTSFNIFSFDKNSKDEAKFVFKIFENNFRKEKPQINVKVFKLSSKVKKDYVDVNSLINEIEIVIGNCIIHKNSLIIYVTVDYGISKEKIEELLIDFEDKYKGLFTGDFFFYLFVFSDMLEIENYQKIPCSAFIPPNQNKEAEYIQNLETLKNEFYKWLNSVDFIEDKDHCRCYYDTIRNNFKKYDDYSGSDYRFSYYFLKFFIMQELNYDIIFDAHLDINLKEIF